MFIWFEFFFFLLLFFRTLSLGDAVWYQEMLSVPVVRGCARRSPGKGKGPFKTPRSDAEFGKGDSILYLYLKGFATEGRVRPPFLRQQS